MKYFEPLNYKITPEDGRLRIRIWQYFWVRAAKALAWIALWVIIAGFSVARFNFFFTCVVVFFSAIFCLVGLLIANNALSDSTLFLNSSELRVRTIHMFTRRSRTFSLGEVSGFGFGFFSHGGPVLKFESAGEWHVLAQGIIERDVEKLQQSIKEHGFQIP